MSYEDTSILSEWLELKAEESELKERMDEAKNRLFDFLTDQPDNRYDAFKGFDFAVQERKTYTYSDHVKQAAEELKAMKKLEEAQGVAKLQRQVGFPVVKKARVSTNP